MNYWHEMSYYVYKQLSSQQRLETEVNEIYDNIDETTWNEWINEEVN